MLRPFGTGLWLADGPPITADLGFRYPTRMAVMKLADGGLAIWSPVALSEGLRDAVEALGPVHHLIAPNSLHHMALPDWLAACPGAAAHGTPALIAKRADIRFAGELGDEPPPDWAGQIDQQVMRGNKITEEVWFHHRPSAALLVTDLIQQLPADWFTGWRALVARLDLMAAPAPSVPRKFRLAWRDRDAARAALEAVRDWHADRLVLAHGPSLESGGMSAVEKAFNWLG